MKHYFDINLKMLLAHVKTQIFSALIGPLVFFMWLTDEMGWYVMGVATTIFYIITVYSSAYKIADRDIKCYSEYKPYALKGVMTTLLTLICTLVLSVLYHISFSLVLNNFALEMTIKTAMQMIHQWWGFCFAGFRTAPDGSISIVYWLFMYLLMPVVALVGYYAGTKKWEISHNFFSWLVYKKDDKK